MKAIVLAGGENSLLDPITIGCPKPLLPLLNRPFLEFQIESLRRIGVMDIGVALSPQDRPLVEARFGDGRQHGVSLHYSEDPIPRGPAGCLLDFAAFVGKGTFLVVGGNVLLASLDLGEFEACHREKRAVITAAFTQRRRTQGHLEKVSFSETSRIEDYEVLHPTRDRRTLRRSVGVYLFEPEVFGLLEEGSFTDIKEQLIPQLRKSGRPVYAYVTSASLERVSSTRDYYRLHQDLMRLGNSAPRGSVHIGDNRWIGENSRVSSQAYVLGPVLIGNDCTVEPHAQIIGPAVIGDGCVIEEGSLVRESVLWSGATIARGGRAEYSVVGSGCSVSPGSQLNECIVVNDRTPVEQALRPATARSPRRQPRPGPWLSAPWNALGALLKRAIDIFGASQGLLLLSPLFVAIAVAIKLDSAGPVFFSQQRCGKGGRPFRMLKFRTMVVNAEKLQKQLAENKDVDGPVFKVFKDPRVTRVGRSLRKLSLDELPQLWNVLAGDMSLVGPRPLVMEEMRFSPSWRDLRLSVKPGITGPWQIGGRSHCSFHDWILKDVSYVRTHSVWRDLVILMKTIFWVFGRIGGY